MVPKPQYRSRRPATLAVNQPSDPRQSQLVRLLAAQIEAEMEGNWSIYLTAVEREAAIWTLAMQRAGLLPLDDEVKGSLPEIIRRDGAQAFYDLAGLGQNEARAYELAAAGFPDSKIAALMERKRGDLSKSLALSTVRNHIRNARAKIAALVERDVP